jgi:hypothetical protein
MQTARSTPACPHLPDLEAIYQRRRHFLQPREPQEIQRPLKCHQIAARLVLPPQAGEVHIVGGRGRALRPPLLLPLLLLLLLLVGKT